MFERFLGVADLHLTANPADDYRWSVFSWMREVVKEHELTDVLLCGDISDFKDEHPADYVNMLVTELSVLAQDVRVHWLMGNHDMIKADVPFFEFINCIPNLYYYKSPEFFERAGVALMPYVKDPAMEWAEYDFSDLHLIFMHQPCIGSKSSDSYTLESGLDAKYFSKNHPEFGGEVFSGDIHIPQTVGDVTYFGAPYDVRFGDNIQGGGLIFIKDCDQFEIEEVEHKSLRKWHFRIDRLEDLNAHIDDVNRSNLKDKAKVTVNFSTEAYTNWHEWKAAITDYCQTILGVELHSIALDAKKANFESVKAKASAIERNYEVTSPLDVIKAYGEKEKIEDDLLAVGETLIKENSV